MAVRCPMICGLGTEALLDSPSLTSCGRAPLHAALGTPPCMPTKARGMRPQDNSRRAASQRGSHKIQYPVIIALTLMMAMSASVQCTSILSNASSVGGAPARTLRSALGLHVPILSNASSVGAAPGRTLEETVLRQSEDSGPTVEVSLAR